MENCFISCFSIQQDGTTQDFELNFSQDNLNLLRDYRSRFEKLLENSSLVKEGFPRLLKETFVPNESGYFVEIEQSRYFSEESLAAFLLFFRPFYLQKESTWTPKICDLLCREIVRKYGRDNILLSFLKEMKRKFSEPGKAMLPGIKITIHELHEGETLKDFRNRALLFSSSTDMNPLDLLSPDILKKYLNSNVYHYDSGAEEYIQKIEKAMGSKKVVKAYILEMLNQQLAASYHVYQFVYGVLSGVEEEL
jgi:hypothetical protein